MTPVAALRPVDTSSATVMLKLEEANHCLAHAKTLHEVTHIYAAAKALRVYAREQKLGREVMQRARAITTEALRRLGGFLRETTRAVGGQPYQHSTGPHLVPVETLADLGLTKKISSLAQHIYDLPPELFHNVRDGQSSLSGALARMKRAANLKALLDRDGGSAAIDLHVCSCADLFASGIRPAAVITELPRSRDHLPAFSELARACSGVPLVVVAVHTPYLPEVMQRLCEHMTYREGHIRNNRLCLVFCHDDDALNRAKARARTKPGVTLLRPYESCEEYFGQTLAGPGELVCDPFLTIGTALAALEFGWFFIGSSVDASVVADARRQLGMVKK